MELQKKALKETYHKNDGEKETGDKHHTEAAQPQEGKFKILLWINKWNLLKIIPRGGEDSRNWMEKENIKMTVENE